jgi:hypothetical protein
MKSTRDVGKDKRRSEIDVAQITDPGPATSDVPGFDGFNFDVGVDKQGEKVLTSLATPKAQEERAGKRDAWLEIYKEKGEDPVKQKSPTSPLTLHEAADPSLDKRLLGSGTGMTKVELDKLQVKAEAFEQIAAFSPVVNQLRETIELDLITGQFKEFLDYTEYINFLLDEMKFRRIPINLEGEEPERVRAAREAAEKYLPEYSLSDDEVAQLKLQGLEDLKATMPRKEGVDANIQAPSAPIPSPHPTPPLVQEGYAGSDVYANRVPVDDIPEYDDVKPGVVDQRRGMLVPAAALQKPLSAPKYKNRDKAFDGLALYVGRYVKESDSTRRSYYLPPIKAAKKKLGRKMPKDLYRFLSENKKIPAGVTFNDFTERLDELSDKLK